MRSVLKIILIKRFRISERNLPKYHSVQQKFTVQWSKSFIFVQCQATWTFLSKVSTDAMRQSFHGLFFHCDCHDATDDHSCASYCQNARCLKSKVEEWSINNFSHLTFFLKCDYYRWEELRYLTEFISLILYLVWEDELNRQKSTGSKCTKIDLFWLRWTIIVRDRPK